MVVAEAAEEKVDKGGDEEVDVIGMESKQMIVDVLVLSLLQNKRRAKAKEEKTKNQNNKK